MTKMTSGPARQVLYLGVTDEPRFRSHFGEQSRKRKREAREKVRRALESGLKTIPEIAAATGVDINVVRKNVYALVGYETPSSKQLQLMKAHPDWDSLAIATACSSSEQMVLKRAFEWGITLKRHYKSACDETGATAKDEHSLSRRRRGATNQEN